MGDWQDAANRGIAFLSGDSSGEATRTVCILRHALSGADDTYISKDFFNVQQAAGGLPDSMTLDQFISGVAGHVRDQLTSNSFDPGLSDADLRLAFLSFDDVIRRHIEFLNGVVHQIAPGDVHMGLWNWILAAHNDGNTLYGDCYRDYIQT